MRYWLLRRPPQNYTDINSAFTNQPYEYDKVSVDPRIHEGDIVYLVAAYNELYGWGYVVKKESYRDKVLNGRAYKLTITRSIIRQNLVPAAELKKHDEIASAFLTEKNLVELNSFQVNKLNQLLGSTGVMTPPEKKHDDVPSFRIYEDFPKLDVPAEDGVWLRAAYDRVKAGKVVSPQELVVELWDQIPDFDYKSIDSRLMKFGVEPTLLGILQIDPTTELCDQTDQVISLVKRKIQMQYKIASITAEEVSEELEIDEHRVRLIFSFMRHLGKFWDGGGRDGNTPGYTTINIDDEAVTREYLKYAGLQPLLERVAKLDRDQQSKPVAEDFVHSTLDWLLGEHLDDALSEVTRLSGADVSAYDTERFAEVVRQHEIVAPVLADDPVRDETMPELEDMTIDLKTGATGHIVLVPIQGDGKWLQEIDMQVVSYDNNPLAFLDKARNWIYIKLTVSPDEPEGILRAKLDARLALVRKYSNYVTRRINSFNLELAEKMVEYLNKRKRALERGRAEAEALGLRTATNPKHAEQAIQIERLTEILNTRLLAGSPSIHEAPESQATEKMPDLVDAKRDTAPIEIFVSHSSKDAVIAKALVSLFRNALNIPAARIRCTSVDGYRLPGGAHTDDELRRELKNAKVFVGLITRRSIQSSYVLFELGARWGAELPLVPVLVSSDDKELMVGPLGGFNALACDSRSQIHQLVTDIADRLGVTAGSPASYQDSIEVVIEAATSEAKQ